MKLLKTTIFLIIVTLLITVSSNQQLHIKGQVILEDEKVLVPPNPNVHDLSDLTNDGSIKEQPSESSPSMMMSSPKSASSAVPTAGSTQKLLMIPVDFVDYSFSVDEATLQSQLNSLCGELKDYYEFNSKYVSGVSGVTVDYTVSQLVTSVNTLAYYGTDHIDNDDAYTYIFELTREAVQLLDADGFDFSSYDTDNDGYVDNIMIVHAGPGQEESPNDLMIWSHKWSIPGGELVDGVRVGEYTMIPETAQLGVTAHEFAHALGLPDLYDTDYETNGESYQIGDWGIMGSGSWNGLANEPDGSTPSNLCAWSRVYLGWETPVEITTDQLAQTISNDNGMSQILKVWPSGDTSGDEYYLVEYRRQIGYDEALPGEGVLIWHIDQGVVDARISSNSINDYPDSLGVALEEADGQRDLLMAINEGDATDPFDGNDVNNYFSFTPNELNASNGDSTLMLFADIFDIQANDSQATMDIYVEATAPEQPVIATPTENSETAILPIFEWDKVPHTDYYYFDLSEDNTFQSSVVSSDLYGHSSTVDYDGSTIKFEISEDDILMYGTNYYFRVGTKNPLIASEDDIVWSSILSFTTSAMPLVEFSFDGNNAFKLIGSDTSMEYSIDGGNSYSTITTKDQELEQSEIDSLSFENDIHIRYKARENVLPSEETIIDLIESPILNGVTSNDVDNTISGMTNLMEFSIDNGTSWMNYDNNLPSLEGEITILIRLKAMGTTFEGIAGSFVFTKSAQEAPIVTFSFDGVNAGKLVGSDTTMEFSLDGGTTYTAISEVDMTLSLVEIESINFTDDIRIRLPETETHYESDSTVLDILEASALNGVLMNDTDNTLSGMTTSMEFSIDGGSTWIKFNDNIPDLNGEISVLVRMYASSMTQVGDPQSFDFLKSTSAEPIVTFSYDGVDAGRLMGSDTTMEYSLDGGATYSSVPEADMMISNEEMAIMNQNDDINIRVAETDFVYVSQATTIDILEGASVEGVMANDIDNTLTGLSNLMEFNSDGGDIWSTYNDNLPSLAGEITVVVRLKATGVTSAGPQSSYAFTKANREAPIVTFSFDGGNAAKLMGSDTTMEYSIDGGTTYNVVSEGDMTLGAQEVTSLTSANDIRIRFIETDTHYAGEALTIDILEGSSISGVAANDSDNTLTGLTSLMEFSTNGGSSWTEFSSNLPDLTGTITVQLRIKATGLTQYGAASSYSFTVPAPPPPSGGGGFVPFIPPAIPEATTEPEVKEVELDDLQEQFTDSETETVIIEMSSETDSGISIDADAFDQLKDSNKDLELDGDVIDIVIPADAFDDTGMPPFNTTIEMTVEEMTAEEVDEAIVDSMDDVGGLFAVGDRIFEFNASWSTPSKTEEVTEFQSALTITIELTEEDIKGTDPDKIGVYYYNEDSGEWEYVGGHYDEETNTLTFETDHFSFYTIMQYDKTFDDISSHWAKTYIEKMAAKHITKGKSETTFDPENNTTRAEFVALVVRALNLKDDGSKSISYNDVAESKWYHSEITTGYSNGILKDMVSFNPDVDITREDMMVIIVDAMKASGDYIAIEAAEVDEILSVYTDADLIADGNREAIALAIKNGIITGRTETTLVPDGTATRAETMVVVSRLLDLLY